jgi:hypothetical protein
MAILYKQVSGLAHITVFGLRVGAEEIVDAKETRDLDASPHGGDALGMPPAALPGKPATLRTTGSLRSLGSLPINLHGLCTFGGLHIDIHCHLGGLMYVRRQRIAFQAFPECVSGHRHDGSYSLPSVSTALMPCPENEKKNSSPGWESFTSSVIASMMCASMMCDVYRQWAGRQARIGLSLDAWSVGQNDHIFPLNPKAFVGKSSRLHGIINTTL